MQTSPLEGIESNSLDELMSRDPLSLGEADIEKIVSVLRAQRAKWAESEAAPKTPKGKRAATASDIADLMKDLKL